MSTNSTKSLEVALDMTALLRTRCPIIWVVTKEEARVERFLFEAASKAGYNPCTWDVAAGARDLAGEEVKFRDPAASGTQEPNAMIDKIAERTIAKDDNAERTAWIMRDLPPFLRDPVLLRRVRNLARVIPTVRRDAAQALIVLSPSGDVPPELANHTTVIDWPLPDRAEIGQILDSIADQYQLDLNGTREPAIDAAIGLSGEEAAACFSKSLVQLKRIDPTAVSQEKKRVIARERVLEWYDPLPGGLESVGGLDLLKAWLVERSTAYSVKARAYGLPAPKGVFLVGISGCGKSLTAKAIATAYGMPLLRLDLGALKSKFVGESEGKIRAAFRVVDTIGKCALWIDEIEKALEGATSGAADGGVSADALGTVLTWMQERKGSSFVVATANDVSKLPPELLRKGRFDDIFFVDLPTASERASILSIALKSNKQSTDGIDLASIAADCEAFTGSEVTEIVPDAMFTAFADGERAVSTDDLTKAAKRVVPLSQTAKEKIDGLRKWAKDRARAATSVQQMTPAEKKQTGRVLDI